ncbi:type III secretion system cytoplasmic ring protein SctQ [Roseateles sp. NT4]|uniref:type III secretion system cytoplasmic ring protein SctQ n=1 Tax=Roseateles sp. NT4 TaxID=3453715 RepID=UPI003EF017C1
MPTKEAPLRITSGAHPFAATELSAAPNLLRIDPHARLGINRLHHRCAQALTVATREASLSVRWLDVGIPHAGLDHYAFKIGPYAGRLGIDLPSLAALVEEPAPSLIPRELRCVLIANALSDCVDDLERTTGLQFEWTLAAPLEHVQAPGHVVSFRIENANWTGTIQFDDQAAWAALAPLPDRSTMPMSSAIDHVALPLRFRVGSTSLKLVEMRSIALGDIVAIEDWISEGAAIVVSADLGGKAGVRFTALAEGQRIEVEKIEELMMDADPFQSADDVPSSDRLEDLEVRLTFELDGIPFTVGELRNVLPGYVFELNHPINKGTVRISANGTLLGKGTLVAVGDQLGVRVGEFASTEGR